MKPSHSDNDNQHGQIRCGTISVVDLDMSVALYQNFLNQKVVETGELDADTAISWGAPGMQGARYALLVSPSAVASCFLRLVELPREAAFTSGFEVARTFGWSAFELTVKDVFKLAKDLEESDFLIVGPPKEVDGFTSFIPMQVFGPNGEILFLNQVNHSEEDVDLPLAQSGVEQIFIVILASPDRQKSVKEYRDVLDLDEAATHHFRYSLLNRAFQFDAETKQTITMVQKGRAPFLQVDQYPDKATERPQKDGFLPPGNSMVSILVTDITEAIEQRQLAPSHRLAGKVYQGRRSVVIQGSASERIELIEITGA